MGENSKNIKKLELAYPVKPVFITQMFGGNGEYYRANGIDIDGHNGIDFLTRRGQEVRAAHDGTVVYAGVDNKEGWGVVIRTNEPRQYNNGEAYFKTIYWHLIPDIPVKVGQSVRVGDIIGFADSTGLSTGDHLHFGLKPQVMGENDWIWYNLEQSNGYLGAIDPYPYFNGYYAYDAQKVIGILTKMIELLKVAIGLINKKLNG